MAHIIWFDLFSYSILQKKFTIANIWFDGMKIICKFITYSVREINIHKLNRYIQWEDKTRIQFNSNTLCDHK